MSSPKPAIKPLVVRPTVAQAMLAGCSKSTLWALINAGKLKSFLQGQARWISVESIEQYVKERLDAQSQSSK